MVPAEVIPEALVPGETFGRYLIEDLLGAGGMSTIYRARDTALGRVVALKILRVPEGGFEDTTTTGGKQRIQREARALAALEHPNVVAVYDVGEVTEGPRAGTAYLTMELVKGRSLGAILRAGRAPLESCLGWLGDAARGLAAVHRCGVVHHDVKPENILVRDDGVVKVLDFGIAKSTAPPPTSTGPMVSGRADTGPITERGMVLGTPYYMSPEQMRGDRVDARSDQFSWAVVAFQLLAGGTPWGEGLDAVNLIARVLGAAAPDVRTRAPDAPAWIAGVIARALAKEPWDRFGSMDEIVAAFDRASEVPYAPTERFASVRVGPPPPGASASGVARGRRFASIAVLVALAAFALTAILRRRGSEAAVEPSLAAPVARAPVGPVGDEEAARAAAVTSLAVSAAPGGGADAGVAGSPPLSRPVRHPMRPAPAPPAVDPFGDRK